MKAMMSQTFLILGGCGNTGRLVAELLLKQTDLNLVLSGRNLEKAEALAATFNQKYPGDRVSAMRVDAAEPQTLKEAFEKVDMVIAASSTSEYARNVAEAAIEIGIDYLDCQHSTAKLHILNSLKEKIERAGCCFITDAGFHPGLPAALVRYSVPYFDSLEKANVGSLIKLNWKELSFSDSTVREMIEELRDFKLRYFKNGQWKDFEWSDSSKKFNFGWAFGKQATFPMFLEEMRTLPQAIPSLKETGFFVGGFNWFVDYIAAPLGVSALNLWQQKAEKPVEELLMWGLKTFSHPPYRTILLLEASGWKDEEYRTMRVEVSHEDGCALTAIPTVACLLQYLDSSIRKEGLWLQAHLAEPARLLKDMRMLGATVEISEATQFVEQLAIA